MSYFKKICLIMLLLVMGFSHQSLAQQFPVQEYCPNADFSSMNFDNWEGYYGKYENPEMYQGFMLRRHTIITDTLGTDPHTCGGLHMVPPGMKVSARLGNASAFSEAEELRYTIPVTSENNLFIYKYAVILEDPGHVPQHQPNFTIEVRNREGNLIDTCGYYYVYAQPQLPGWHTCLEGNLPVIWKDWTTVGLDLRSMMGDTVTIVFTTRDCQEGAHFGYAYISAFCSQMQLTVGYCTNKDYVTVTAPPGFSYLWDDGRTTQSIVVTNPYPGKNVQCILTAVNGCQVTTESTIQPTFMTTGFTSELKCSLEPVQFRDTSSVSQNYIAGWSWDFGDGTPKVTGKPDPVHVYAEGGDYKVTMEVMSSDSCYQTASRTIHVIPNVSTELPTSLEVRKDHFVTLDAGNPGARFLWSTGDTTQQITVGSDERMYWVKITRGQCSLNDTVMIHTLYGCSLNVPNAFSPNGDGENDILKVFPVEVGSFDLSVFDRSGEMVYHTTNAESGWDGTYRGNPLGMGVFHYLLKVKCIDGTEYTTKGNITLLR